MPNWCKSYDDDAYGDDDPKLAEWFVRWYLRTNYSDGLGIAFQPLQIGANLRGVLVPEISILFQTLIDDAFQFGWQVRVQTYCRCWCPIENGFKHNARTLTTKRQGSRRHLVEHGPK